MRMGTVNYCAGSGHEKESRSVTDGRCGSWVYARTAKRQPKTRLGDEGQGRLVESRMHTGGHALSAKALHKNGQKEPQAKKQTEQQTENRQQTQTYLQKHNNTKH